MYPFVRLFWGAYKARSLPKLGPFEPHVSQHICWPWDIDPWIELNNGRTLTLYDLGRMPWLVRAGIGPTLRANRWGMAVAGASVRYRRRVKAFDRFTMVTRLIGWDEKFFYIDQSMWRHGECTSQVLIRSATTTAAGKSGIVPPATLLEQLGRTEPSPALPKWVRDWVDAEAERPWPPEAGKYA